MWIWFLLMMLQLVFLLVIVGTVVVLAVWDLFKRSKEALRDRSDS